MNNYLIFRTDRIGDFLITCILINNIKRNDPTSFVTIVCSPKNYDYISRYKNVDMVLLYKKNIFSYFINILKLIKKKYKFSILHDEKDRSKILNLFLRKNKTISIEKNQSKSKIEIVQKIINDIGFEYSKEDLNFLDIKKDLTKASSNNYLVFHYDEKWSNNTYISEYVNIEPSISQLRDFISKLRNKLNYKIIITTGNSTPNILKKFLSSNSFNDVEVLLNQNFFELEQIVSNSKLLISCHGSITHVAGAKNIKQIDIIDKSYDYSKWTSHIRNYNSIYRKKFANLSNEIFRTL